jgi:WD40 repeat protein
MGNKSSKKKEKSKSYLLQTCEEHEGSINCMDVSEDGSVLVTGSDDSTVRLWSTKSEAVECIGLLEGHEDYITSVLIEDNYVLSSSADTTIRKWNMSTCECQLVFMGHESTVNKMVCTGDFIFSVSYDKKARCWDFDTGECVRIFTGHKNNVTSLLFIPAERENMSDAINFVKMHAERKNLALKGGKLAPISKINNKNQTAKQAEDDDDEIYSKDLIVTGSLDSVAKSWSIETGECVQTFRGHKGAVTCLATDPLGKLLFTGSADHSIRSWEIMTGQPLKIFTGHQTTIISLLVIRLSFFFTYFR